jgi:hypothetical protein
MVDSTFLGPVTGGYMTPDYSWIHNPDTLELGIVQIDASAAADAGNTDFRTTYLRPGLALGQITATGLYKEYTPAASDGTETIKAILMQGVDLLDPFGNTKTEDPAGVLVCVKGHVVAANIILDDAAGRVDLLAAGFVLKEDYES